jgi:hypothetical protein
MKILGSGLSAFFNVSRRDEGGFFTLAASFHARADLSPAAFLTTFTACAHL